MNALDACKVCHHYGAGNAVLKDFDLAIRPGSFEALMGPSGSGKSTFLHLACGLLLPDSGKIEIGGREITQMSDTEAAVFRREHLGVIFQSFNLVESLDVCANIALPLKLAGSPVDRERLDRLLDFLGISAKRKALPQHLSGGERQRVAVARALVAKPDVVLADEPTGNLDMEASARLCETLSSLNRVENSAILLVTHDPMVAAYANKVHFMKDGRICASLEAMHDASEISKAYLEFCR